jgi:hypothetical protein
LTNDLKAITFGNDRFEWISTTGVNPCNTVRKGIDRDPNSIGDYLLSRSQIWNYSKSIWDNLFGRETDWNERWFENIVWSNLYKIAPHGGGNPAGRLQKKQKEACKELLKAEIDYFKPTHIFFATARDGWFDGFSSLFQTCQDVGTNVFSGKNKNEQYVEVVGEYIYEDGQKAKIVVACRPEGRGKELYVNQVSSYFR